MGVVTKGTAIIVNKNTGETFEIQSEELDWQPQEAAPGTEPGQRHVAQVDHPVLGTLIWSIWEYPGTSENIRETDPNGHSMEQDFEYWFESEEEMGAPAAAQDNQPFAAKPEKPARSAAKPKAGAKGKAKTKAKSKTKAKAKPKAAKKKKPIKKAKVKKPAKKAVKKKTKKAASRKRGRK